MQRVAPRCLPPSAARRPCARTPSAGSRPAACLVLVEDDAVDLVLRPGRLVLDGAVGEIRRGAVDDDRADDGRRPRIDAEMAQPGAGEGDDRRCRPRRRAWACCGRSTDDAHAAGKAGAAGVSAACAHCGGSRREVSGAAGCQLDCAGAWHLLRLRPHDWPKQARERAVRHSARSGGESGAGKDEGSGQGGDRAFGIAAMREWRECNSRPRLCRSGRGDGYRGIRLSVPRALRMFSVELA